MKRKLSNQFLRNFLVIFLLTILATVLAFVLLSFASRLISGSLTKNQYPASAIIIEDYRQIDASAVVQTVAAYRLWTRNTVSFRAVLTPSGKIS